MASNTEIANIALSHLGVGKEIANLETEKSQEAAACRRYFETARDATLRDFPWPFATKLAALALVTADPNDEWDFSYQVPTDCLKFRRILSGTRNDSRQTRVPYRLAYGDAGEVIFTDFENAEGEYTVRIDDPSRYPPDFIIAFSFRLASYVAPRITGGDPFNVGERALKLYAFEISRASSTAINEEQVEEDPESELIRGRE